MAKNQVRLLTLSFVSVAHYFKALYAWFGVVHSTHLVKLNQLIAFMDLCQNAKKGFHTLSIGNVT